MAETVLSSTNILREGNEEGREGVSAWHWGAAFEHCGKLTKFSEPWFPVL